VLWRPGAGAAAAGGGSTSPARPARAGRGGRAKAPARGGAAARASGARDRVVATHRRDEHEDRGMPREELLHTSYSTRLGTVEKMLPQLAPHRARAGDTLLEEGHP